MPDRTIPPPFRPIKRPRFAWPQAASLVPGLPLWVLHAGTQPIVKLELIFDAGTWYEPHPGVAHFTAKMLLEGTQHRSAQEIARYIDQYGASLAVKVQPDTWSLTLVTLSKHLTPMLALLAELLLAPGFPAERLDHLKQRKREALKLAAEKNSHLARRHFQALLFGDTHPYGRHLTEDALAAITLTQIQQYYQNQLLAGCRVLVSGQVDDQALTTIRQYLQPLPVQAPPTAVAQASILAPDQLHVPKPDSLQAALNLGKVLPPKSHPDYLPLLVVNELLGGFFGSRLMRNLREDKGYTYGISARIVSLQQTAYLVIATEVIQAQARAACQEIDKEIERLQTVPVSPEELGTLQNHMLGAWLAAINTPFAVMDQFKAVYLHGLDRIYYEQLYDTITQMTSPQIMALSQQYLDGLSRVVVG
ncbi:MAG: pitrilysin family protein [Bacteroidota bacterium]